MNLVDPQHPFYRPLWRRILIVVFCVGWGAFELARGSAFWGVLFGGAGLYCAWEFFYNARPEDDAGHADAVFTAERSDHAERSPHTKPMPPATSTADAKPLQGTDTSEP